MDEKRFEAAERAYALGDFKGAARDYLAATQGQPPEGTGRAYHQAGNALMKLHRYSDAATVYGHAIKDPAYDKRGIVLTNLGSSLVAAGRFDDAVAAFESALEEPDYFTPWKALQGKAGALYKNDRFEEAASVYREAAWTEGNPDPGKALNNLGLCFMALERPEEAIEAYKAALAIESYDGRGKAAANLGLAYAVMGFSDESLSAFETAIQTYDHELTGAALAAYERVSEAVPAGEVIEAVEGWTTGEMEPVAAGEARWGEQDTEDEEQAPTFDEDSRFFTMSEEDMRKLDRDNRRAERTPQANLKTLAMVGIALVVVIVGLVVAWYAGLGFPTQGSTVAGMVDSYRAGRPVESFWVAVPSTDIREEMRHLPAEFAAYKITGVRRGAASSVVRMTVTTAEGAQPLAYDVLLVREGVGWKVNGIRNAWSSNEEGS